MKRLRLPQVALARLPRDLQPRVRQEWWRLNRRSWQFWGGVVVMCASPLIGLWIGNTLGVRRTRHLTTREMLVNVATIGGTFLTGFAVFLLTSGRIGARNFAAALRSHGLCPACGYDLAGNAGGVCPECGTAK